MTTDFRALCAELVKDFDDLQESSEGVAGFHRNGDLAPWEELSESGRYPWLSSFDRARALLAQEAVGPSEKELYDLFCEHAREPVESMRAALARWGRPAAAPVAEDVAELVEWLLLIAGSDNSYSHARLTRAATLLQQQQHLLKLACQELDNFMEQQQAAPVTAPVPEAEGPTDEELEEEFGAALLKLPGDSMNTTAVAFARAILARWGRPAAAPAPEPGEVAELVLMLHHAGDALRLHGVSGTARACDRAATLLQQQAAPVPGASNTYFEFVIFDADYCTQAEGIAPTYAQALSEGQHYLAQYQQDGPHTLELRRVEVLNPDALPLPAPEETK